MKILYVFWIYSMALYGAVNIREIMTFLVAIAFAFDISGFFIQGENNE